MYNEQDEQKERTENRNSILVVDDAKLNLICLNRILGDDYTVYTARDAKGVLEQANTLLPDLILLDIILPDIDGYETLSALKTSERTKDIPVIFISGLSSSEDEMKGLLLGAEDYITKPFNDAIVKLRVRNQIKIVNQIRAIERLSNTDQLTEIANKRSFNQQLNMEWRRAVRDKLPISILMIDVDKFKNYNDTYGHLQGDVVLRVVAQTLTRTLKRSTDFAARWGGEEFAVLLPGVDMNGATVIAELIREAMEKTVIPCADGRPTSVTLSVGVNSRTPALTDSTNDAMNTFVHKADIALYAAKETGRNRVCRAQ